MKGKKNPVAKNLNKYNKPAVQRDRKKDSKRGKMKNFKQFMDEKLTVSDTPGEWIKDFRKSDAPQFKGKSDKKKQKMAIAAYLDARRRKGMDEEVDLDEASLRKSIATNSGKFPEGSMVMHKKTGQAGKVMTVGKDFVKVSHGKRGMKDYHPSELGKLNAKLDLSRVPSPPKKGSLKIKKEEVEQIDEVGPDKAINKYKKRMHQAAQSATKVKPMGSTAMTRSAAVRMTRDKMKKEDVELGEEKMRDYLKRKKAEMTPERKAALAKANRDMLANRKTKPTDRNSRFDHYEPEGEMIEEYKKGDVVHVKNMMGKKVPHTVVGKDTGNPKVKDAWVLQKHGSGQNVSKRASEFTKEEVELEEASQKLVKYMQQKHGIDAIKKMKPAEFRAASAKAKEELKSQSATKKATPAPAKPVTKTSKGKVATGRADPADKHIVMQLRKAADYDTGHHDIRVSPKRSVKLHSNQIKKLVTAHDNLKKAEDKRRFRVGLIKKLRKM